MLMYDVAFRRVQEWRENREEGRAAIERLVQELREMPNREAHIITLAAHDAQSVG